MINETLLIVGKAATNYQKAAIEYFESYSDAAEKYGVNHFSEAFKIAQSFGMTGVHMANIQSLNEYFSLSSFITEYNFTYVVFLDLYLSDTYADPISGKETSYLQYILEKSTDTSTVFFITGKHASLYNDIDSFIRDTKQEIDTFKKRCSTNIDLRNVQYVANNLNNYDFGNLILALMFLATDVSEYPNTRNLPQVTLGEAIFYIDNFDINELDFSYFKTTSLTGTTIENLLNLQTSKSPLKIAFIDRIVRYITKLINFDDYIGQGYSEYKRAMIAEKEKTILESLKNRVISDYTVHECYAVQNTSYPGTVVVILTVSIVPIGIMEEVKISIKKSAVLT